MLAIKVKFRDENGETRRGELVNPFRILINGTTEVAAVIQENPAEVDVLTINDGEMQMHRVPTLAIIYMREVAFV